MSPMGTFRPTGLFVRPDFPIVSCHCEADDYRLWQSQTFLITSMPIFVNLYESLFSFRAALVVPIIYL